MEIPSRFRIVPDISPRSVEDDAEVALGWWFEQLLTRVRWFAIPIGLLTVWLFPVVPVWILVLPALVFGLGNTGAIWLLRRPPTAENLHVVKVVATLIDWIGTFASLIALSSEPMAATPAILVLLTTTTTLRFGFVGLTLSGIVTVATIGVLAAAQALHFGAITSGQAIALVCTWAIVVGVTMLVTGVLSRGFRIWQLSERSIHSEVRDTVLRLQYGLTAREWQVLKLLSVYHLTYEDIGRELSISDGTVKAHVRNIGDKLDVRGRHAVVAEAHKLNLLSSHSIRRQDSLDERSHQ